MLLHGSTGQLFVVSAPSGVGKTTLIKRILPKWPDLRFSVSCTTRLPRPGEHHGTDYSFISRKDFLEGIRKGRFLEWAQVHGELYGTDGEQVAGWLRKGCDVLLDIDVQGARQVRILFPGAHTVFILPPSMEVLRERLQARRSESPEKLAKRLAAARMEIEQAAWYDFIVVNDVLDDAVADLNAIIHACRCRLSAQAPRLRSLLAADSPLPEP